MHKLGAFSRYSMANTGRRWGHGRGFGKGHDQDHEGELRYQATTSSEARSVLEHLEIDVGREILPQYDAIMLREFRDLVEDP